MTHLSTLKARVRPHWEKHTAALNLRHVDYRIVRKKDMPRFHWRAWGVAMYYQRRVYLQREALEEHMDDPLWIEDMVVHELFHFKAPAGHGKEYRRAIVAYGFHPMAIGWRKK